MMQATRLNLLILLALTVSIKTATSKNKVKKWHQDEQLGNTPPGPDITTGCGLPSSNCLSIANTCDDCTFRVNLPFTFAIGPYCYNSLDAATNGNVNVKSNGRTCPHVSGSISSFFTDIDLGENPGNKYAGWSDNFDGFDAYKQDLQMSICSFRNLNSSSPGPCGHYTEIDLQGWYNEDWVGVTWYDAGDFEPQPLPANTFRVSIVVDSTYTYAVFDYFTIEWVYSRDICGFTLPEIGWRDEANNGERPFTTEADFWNLPYTTNADRPGRWIFYTGDISGCTKK